MKRCTRCSLTKPLEEFASRRRSLGTLQSWCRACHREHAALRFQNLSPERRAERRCRNNERVARLRQEIWDFLAGKECVDCGERDVVVLDFDHVDGRKTGNIGDMIGRVSRSRVEREIASCEVRCANCHRRKTAERRLVMQPTSSPRRPQRPAAEQARAALLVSRSALAADEDCENGRRCERCRRIKPLDAFAWRWRDRGIRQPWCRDCHNAQKRVFYALNRESEILRARTRQSRIVAANLPRIRQFLEEHPCADCGERDVVVLEFDHIGTKKSDVKTMLWNGTLWPTIEREIAECQVRCANCHRRRTARRQGYADRKRGLSEEEAEYSEPEGNRTPVLRVRSAAL